MKKLLLLSFIIISGILHSQNWNVFNNAYRYNYKYNYSNLVSNVLFVDTVKQSGADTIYTLNRIGVECMGSCPTITTALSPTVTYVVPNMPQFLQRCIKKYSNGLVQLFDTTKIVIVPACSLNQTWLFDSVFNKTAVCTNISTISVFGNTDSIKTIIIQNVDTLILSKSFGILLFPDPYAKNKYYRLSGIEKKSSYDLTSLYGEKVPNAWDFYNYDVGDVMCYYSDYNSTQYQPSGCARSRTTITSKTLSVNGFIYGSIGCSVTANYNVYGFQGACNAPPNVLPPTCSSGTNSISSSFLSSPTLACNFMYPNEVYNMFYTPGNIAKFGNDNLGRFYKYCGQPCSASGPMIMPNLNAIKSLYMLQGNILAAEYGYGDEIAICYGSGFGEIRKAEFVFEIFQQSCLTSFLKGGVQYFGNLDPIGVPENTPDKSLPLIYPNPASTTLNVQIIEPSKVQITNIFGQSVYCANAEHNEKIDISDFANGIYFVSVKNGSFSFKQKLVVVRH